MQQLPPSCAQDRAMYAVGSLISGNSAARSFIFFYALALHAVIFLILARCAYFSKFSFAACLRCLLQLLMPRRFGAAVSRRSLSFVFLILECTAFHLLGSQCSASLHPLLPTHPSSRTSHTQVEHLESLEETCMRLHLGGTAAAHLAAAAGSGGAALGQAAAAAGGAAAAAAGAAGGAAQQAGAAALRLLRLR